jgi:hypothetical protein
VQHTDPHSRPHQAHLRAGQRVRRSGSSPSTTTAAPASSTSQRARARSSGPACRADPSLRMRSASSCMRWRAARPARSAPTAEVSRFGLQGLTAGEEWIRTFGSATHHAAQDRRF